MGGRLIHAVNECSCTSSAGIAGKVKVNQIEMQSDCRLQFK